MATTRQKLVVGKMVENGGSIYRAMIAAGYSPATAKTPGKLTKSKGFQELMEDVLSDATLIKHHEALLNSKKLDHMVFPPAPLEDDDEEPDPLDKRPKRHTDKLTDEDIMEMIESVGGTVRRIAHGEQARHVYFWAANDTIREKALKLAYEVTGKLGKKGDEDPVTPFTQININTPHGDKMVDSFAEWMRNTTMPASRREVIDVEPS